MYHYQFKPTPRPILVDNNGHEYKYAFVSNLERLTYMGIPFSVIYLDQAMKMPPAREEVSFMDKVTKIPDPIENSVRTGNQTFPGMIPPRQAEHGMRTSPMPQPMNVRGGYQTFTGHLCHTQMKG